MWNMVKKTSGFTLQVSAELADILGVSSQDDVMFIIKGDEVILRPKKIDPEHIKKQKEKSDQLMKQLMKDFAPVFEKLAKT